MNFEYAATPNLEILRNSSPIPIELESDQSLHHIFTGSIPVAPFSRDSWEFSPESGLNYNVRWNELIYQAAPQRSYQPTNRLNQYEDPDRLVNFWHSSIELPEKAKLVNNALNFQDLECSTINSFDPFRDHFYKCEISNQQTCPFKKSHLINDQQKKQPDLRGLDFEKTDHGENVYHNHEKSQASVKTYVEVGVQTEGFVSPLCGPFFLVSTKEVISNEELQIMQEGIPLVRLELLKMLVHPDTQEVGLGLTYREILYRKWPLRHHSGNHEYSRNANCSSSSHLAKSFDPDSQVGLSVSQKNELHLNKYMEQWEKTNDNDSKGNRLNKKMKYKCPRMRIFGNGDQLPYSKRANVLQDMNKNNSILNGENKTFTPPNVIMAKCYYNHQVGTNEQTENRN